VNWRGEQVRIVACDDRDSDGHLGVGLRRARYEHTTASKLIGLRTLDCMAAAARRFEPDLERRGRTPSVEHHGVGPREDDSSEEAHQ
jgi:hypothetical protein